MTDARFPERWLNDRRFMRLSDRAFRLYFIALTWSVANRTDGRLDVEDLRLLPMVDLDAVDELAKLELWRPVPRDNPPGSPGDSPPGDSPRGWIIVDFADTQTSSDELAALEASRRRDREKKARQRTKQKAVPGDSPGGQSRGKSRGHVPGESPRPGQDRPGQASLSAERERSTEGTDSQSAPRSAHAPRSALSASHTEEQHNGSGVCVAPGCDLPARRGCRTCWDHARTHEEAA